MLLCLDIGNTHVCGGVFAKDKVILRFRHPTLGSITSDQIGIFLRNILRENAITPDTIKHIAYCSVVPSFDYSLVAACQKYFHINPFVLQYGIKTNFSYHTKNPAENGADIVASIMAAVKKHPQQNLILVDLGTVTTFVVVTKRHEYLGASFIPGLDTARRSLATDTAKLFTVEILRPTSAVGRTTTECIQSGLFFGHLGALKEIVKQINKEIFAHEPALVIATGGFAHIFRTTNIFCHIVPDLVLEGIKIAYELNTHAYSTG